MNYKLGSLFDGSGGFPLAGFLCGIETVWAAEVEPYPIAVTRSRFPKMKHLGNICKVNGAEVEPVDIITFGSPCQDLSVAGKRAGLKHEDNGDDETTRSGLFMEAVRIIKEMRNATNGRYPTYALWENVHGAFSSNKGEDFRIVLEELIKIAEPTAVMPPVPKGGWAYSDSYRGDGWSLAYRTFDAQYWGVPQRRRRIYLVADFRGGCAQKVLFERKGLRRYSSESGTQGQGIAADAEGGIGADDREGTCYGIDHVITTGGNCTAQGSCVYEDIQATLKAGGTHAVCYTLKIRSGCEGGGKGALVQENKSATLATNNDQYLFQPIGVDSYNLCDTGAVSRTLAASRADNEHLPCVCYAVDQGGGKSGANVLENKSPTLCTTHGGEPVVAIRNSYQEKCGSLCARDYKWVGNQYVDEDKLIVEKSAAAVDCRNATENTVNGTIQFGAHRSLNCNNVVRTNYIVRRLTPTECARLQGFPDRWGDIDHKDDFTDEEYKFWLEVRKTHDEINGRKPKDYTKKQMLTWYNNLHTDSAEYKMWGNGIALPTALYCMEGIADALKEKNNENNA